MERRNISKEVYNKVIKSIPEEIINMLPEEPENLFPYATRVGEMQVSAGINDDVKQLMQEHLLSDEEYLKKMQEIVYTEKPDDIFSLIYNYKVELETNNKIDELKKVQELEEYLKNNAERILRYQYKLGYKEEQFKEIEQKLPSLGSEESHMYCVCRDRMKKNRTSWSRPVGAEAILKVIMSRMNTTLEELLNHKSEEKIKEELAQRIAEPIKVKKAKQGQIIYAGKYEVASNFTGSTKQYVVDLLRGKKCSELILIN